jgi:hypothetical protein
VEEVEARWVAVRTRTTTKRKRRRRRPPVEAVGEPQPRQRHPQRAPKGPARRARPSQVVPERVPEGVVEVVEVVAGLVPLRRLLPLPSARSDHH